jgi:lipid-A-disaccharide synthase
VRHYPGLWDQLLCLLPFEPAFFARHGLTATFVGHPVSESAAGRGDAARFRAAHGIDVDARVLTLMPGSRRTEVSRLLPVLGETLLRLPDDLVPVVPLAGPVVETVRDGTRQWRRQPILISGEQDKYDAFAASSVALTKSGTSTLELAMADVPMVVAYRVNPMTAAIANWLVKVRYASIINLIAEHEVIPEFIQGACTPERLTGTVLSLLNDAKAARAQRTAMRAVLERLRPDAGTPSAAAADAVLKVMEQS